MGRILRIGVDDVTNYSFLETSAYDEDNPAATTGPWSDDDAMDQSFKQASPTEVTAEGVLVTFERFPDAFIGAMVKIRPTYDADAGEDPYLEMWLHDSETLEWTLKRAIQLRNPFIGVATGARKVFDLTFFPLARNVDQVWITMNPGNVGTPTTTFMALKLFGYCEATLPTEANGAQDPCANPSDPFYTGFDNEGNDCEPIPGAPVDNPPFLDLCNPASIDQYRKYIEDIPGFLEVFDAWLNNNADAIALYCSGFDPTPPTPPSPPQPPNALPPLDLCDDDSIDAFRAALAGDADAVADFDDFLDALEAAGFFELACPVPPPPEEYTDPNTMEAADEPDPEGNYNAPFGQGPGGQPISPLAPPQESIPPHGEVPDADRVENIGWMLRADSNDVDFNGGTCSHTNATTTTQAIIDLNAGSELFNDCAEHNANPLVAAPLTNPTFACGTGFPFPNTITVVTSNVVFFDRVRVTFDGGIAHARVQVEMELGAGAQATFTQSDYDAIVNPSVPKIYFNLLGAPDPDTHSPNEAIWDDISTLGPLDFEVDQSFIGPDGDGAFGLLQYAAMRITITTQGDNLTNLTVTVQ